MNIRKIVRIAAKPGKADAMRDALITLERATRAEPGCVAFTFFQAVDDAETFLLIEDFADQAALDTHMALPHTRAFFDLQLAAGIQAIDPAWLQ